MISEDEQHTETILLTYTRPTERTVDDAEISAWYAVAMQLHQQALAAQDAPGGHDERKSK